MVLIAYANSPTMQNMPATSVAFQDQVFLHGNNAADTVCVVFQQIQSPNWEIINVGQHNFAVTGSGARSFPDTLQFRLKPGGTRVVNETIPVFSECFLQSSQAHRIQTTMSVIVK
jgi:hypothetical protein